MSSAKGVIFQRILPFLHFLLQLVTLHGAEIGPASLGQKSNKGASKELVCPPPHYRPETPETMLLNLLPCATSKDCPLQMELGILCCKTADGKQSRCRYGVIPPKPKPTHLPILGVERQCPEKDPLPEFLPIKNCTGDNDCWPRICCDGYCRMPDLPKLIQADSRYTSLKTLKNVAEYLQCTPPPRNDFFRKTCLSLRDCFPLVCCQENDEKVCRPGKKSILPLLVSLLKEGAGG